jgi:hypothetical protein
MASDTVYGNIPRAPEQLIKGYGTLREREPLSRVNNITLWETGYECQIATKTAAQNISVNANVLIIHGVKESMCVL